MIRTDGRWLRDEQGRALILRGANVGGSSKVPSRDASFLDRPFPLDKADEHFRRLRDWGLGLVRLVVTWEAVEHRGPGEYDREYLEYLEALVARGGSWGLRFVVDFHQDVWSRFTGGDGAPRWTLELAGLDPDMLHPTGAAVIHDELARETGRRPPNLLWPTNAWKLGAATMATLFFAGDLFAPHLRVQGLSVQELLQERYLGFAAQVARVLAKREEVVGFDLMNEPQPGYIGYRDLASDRCMSVRVDAVPTPFDGMAAGMGFPREVPVYRTGLLGVRRVGRRLINPDGLRAWLPGFECPWLRHRVWEVGRSGPVLLDPGYFAAVDGRPVSFGRDFLRPFLGRVGREVRAAMPEALLFVQDAAGGQGLPWSESDGSRAVHAGHWYDGLTMVRRRFTRWLCVDERTYRPSVGPRGVRRFFRRQIGALGEASERDMGGIPTLVGEFGLPFDRPDRSGSRGDAYASHVRALDAYYDALDHAMVGGTIWNYTPDNTRAAGDSWNGEDFSIYCRDRTLEDGGRGVEGFSRPYGTRIAGTPLAMGYDPKAARFSLAFRHDPAVRAPTELFVPARFASGGLCVEVSDGTWLYDPERHVLSYTHDPARAEHSIAVTGARS